MEISSDNGGTKTAVVLAATMSSFLTPFMASSVNIALPAISEELGMDAILLGWVTTSYLLAAAVFLIPFGRLADIYGKKRLFTIGIMGYTVFSLLCGISPSAAALIVFRVLQGISAATIFGTGVAMLTSVYPGAGRGRVLGMNSAAVYMGQSVGPFLGGFLTQNFGWKSIFFSNVPIGLVILVTVFWKLRNIEWAEAKGEKLDFAGSAIYCLGVVAMMYGLTLLPESSAVGIILVGTIGILAFVWWEGRVESPILNMRLFRDNRIFALSNLAALLNHIAAYAVTFLLSLYLQYIKGFDPQVAGLVLIAKPVIQALCAPFAGRLSDRIEPRIIGSAGMALTAVSLFMFAFLENDTSLAFIVASLLIIGIGLALFASPNTNAVMSSVEKKFYGVASGTLATMRLIGQLFSMGITMLLFSLLIGRVKITPEYYSAFLQSAKIAFAIFAVLCFIGIFPSLARGKTR